MPKCAHCGGLFDRPIGFVTKEWEPVPAQHNTSPESDQTSADPKEEISQAGDAGCEPKEGA